MITARHRHAALLVAGCYSTEMLDGTSVTTASTQIGRSLGAPATDVLSGAPKEDILRLTCRR